MSKSQKITTIILSCFFVVLGIVMLIWYFGATYSSFYASATKEFEICGLNEGFTPQGLCYEKNSKLFLSCGYMKDGSASRIYVTKENSKTADKYFTLKHQDVAYTGHAGGIETDGTSVWIAGESKVVRFAFAQIETVKNGGTIEILDTFETPNGADFLTVENGNLWIGEFHREGKYDTDASHFVETENGKINKAISLCYEIDENLQYGLKSLTPTKALSTPSLVQGMIITDEKIVISTSYSLPDSHLYTYENLFSQGSTKTFELNGTTIPLFVLEDKVLKDDLQAPCMSEELALANGKIYIMFESACQKYGMFTREPLRNVYSIPA